jgi:hypothetical protein
MFLGAWAIKKTMHSKSIQGSSLQLSDPSNRDSNHINLLHHCYNTTKTGNAAGAVIGIYGTSQENLPIQIVQACPNP